MIRNRETGAVTGGYSQRVDFARMPDYCGHCCHVGHNESACLVLGNKPKQYESSNPQNKGKGQQTLSLPARTENVEKAAKRVGGNVKILDKEKNLLS